MSDNVHGFHIDANGIVSEQAQGGVRRAQFGQTLSISHSLSRLTISGEIWHFSQPFERSNAEGNLWAASYPVRKNLVIDGGFDHGLTKTSTQWEFFSGLRTSCRIASGAGITAAIRPKSTALSKYFHSAVVSKKWADAFIALA